MRFGVGMYSTQKPPDSDRPHRDLYEDMLRQARLAEKVGLDSFWIALLVALVASAFSVVLEVVLGANDDDLTHNVYSTAKGNEFNLRAQAPGTSASITLTAEGTVEIHCAFHPKMKLIVTVKK